MRLALLQVKEELGTDAVIMSNKKVTGGVEIVAAVDGDSEPAKNTAPPVAPAGMPQAPKNILSSGNSNANLSANRELGDDRVSLQSGKSNTRRFANMLNQYESAAKPTDPQGSEADSLASLLQRQSEQRTEASLGRAQANSLDGPLSSSLGENSGLAKLIAEDRRVPKPPPQLDPTRFDRNSTRNESDEETSKELHSMREEMESIRRLLEHQISGLMWQEVERREPLRAMLIKRLERMGISADLADQLACYIPDETPPEKAWLTLLRLIADQIVTTKKDILKHGGVVALLGPTGVGKTTTIAKLAARAAMEYGPENVALVTTDTYRIGAHEQLSIYGRIMGCPVKIAKDSQELAEVIYQLRNRRLVLVDTAGMGQRDVRLTEQLDTLMQESGEVISSYLVLPATAQRQVLQETIDHFKRIPLSGCILTKLDESLSLGEFISVIVENALPISYVANGQRVPEDIVFAKPNQLVAKANELLEKSTDDEPHYWNSDGEGF